MSDPVATFQTLRPRLFGLAYHMLGSVGDAEDVMQDAYLRWHRVAHERVEQPQAFLMRTVTNLCLDATARAYRRRTDYLGEWLPDPRVEEEGVEQEEALSLALLRLMEQLTPPERAVFVMRELFDYRYREISDAVGKSEAACRQLFHRAQQKVQRDAVPADREVPEEWLWRFWHALRDGDVGPLMRLLADDAVLYSDGGGKATAALKPIVGADRVVRFLMGILRKSAAPLVIRPLRANGSLGVLVLVDGQPTQLLTVALQDGRLREMQIMANPDKLAIILSHSSRRWSPRP